MSKLLTGRIMKQAMIVALLFSVLGAGGCSNAIRSTSVEATDLSSIQVGATRETVESMLGQPIESVSCDHETIDVYEYDRGHPGGGDGPWRRSRGNALQGDPRAIVLIPFVEAVLVPLEIIRRQQRISEQKGEMQVRYGPDNNVMAFRPRQRDKAHEAELTGSESRIPNKYQCSAATVPI